jgi:hypothetical protein
MEADPGAGDQTVRYPAKTSIVLTRAEASCRHIEAAITAFEEEQFDVSITLAGAAEGMAPEPKPGEGPTLFSFSRDQHSRIGATDQELTKALNVERDWLKHAGEPHHPDTREISRWAAAYMLFRAIDKAQAAGFQGEAIESKFWLWKTKLNAVLFE